VARAAAANAGPESYEGPYLTYLSQLKREQTEPL
jgi:hypothetical protein